MGINDYFPSVYLRSIIFLPFFFFLPPVYNPFTSIHRCMKTSKCSMLSRTNNSKKYVKTEKKRLV